MIQSRTFQILLGLTVVGPAMGIGSVSAQAAPEVPQAPVVEAPSPAATGARAVAFTVVNDNWSDMKVYALRNGRRYRLGTVTSLRSATFRLPGHLQADVSEVRLLAVPIGGSRSVVSPVVLVNPGDEISWRIDNNLGLSGTPIG